MKYYWAFLVIALGSHALLAQTTDTDILTESATKIIHRCPHDPDMVIIESKDDFVELRAQYANETVCNIFRLLQNCGVPVAFAQQLDETKFLAPRYEDIAFKIVVQREAHDDFCVRYPHIPVGYLFPHLVLECFFTGSESQKDPLIEFVDGKVKLYKSTIPLRDQKPFACLDPFPHVEKSREQFEQMGAIARFSFLVLEKAWQLRGERLTTISAEFGLDSDGNPLLTNVDCNGLDNTDTADMARRMRDLASHFELPQQRIIVWRDSVDDNGETFNQALVNLGLTGVNLVHVASAAHESPVHTYLGLQQLVHNMPNTVIIVYADSQSSNAQLITANTHVPVIFVPTDNTPHSTTDTSIITTSDPTRALEAATQILALRNPLIYAQVRLTHEEKMVNCLLM